MGNTGTKLQGIRNSKAAIKQALINKKKEPTEVLSTYAGLIDEIDPVEICELGEIWRYTGPSAYSAIYALAVGADNSVYFGGYTSGDLHLLYKYNPEGEEVWQFAGHTLYVQDIAVDSDGYIYSGSTDKTVRKISPDGVEVWRYTGHTTTIYSVAVDSEGYVYSGSGNPSSQIHKISPDGEFVWRFPDLSNVWAVAVDQEGYVYSGSKDYTVRKISPDGTQIWSFTGHTGETRAVAVDQEGYVYSGSTDKTVRKISPDGTEVWSFTEHTGTVLSVAVDQEGYVYSGSTDKTVRKISPDGTQIWSFTGNTSGIYGVAVDSEGYVYSGSASPNGTVRKIQQPSLGSVYLAPDKATKYDIYKLDTITDEDGTVHNIAYYK